MHLLPSERTAKAVYAIRHVEKYAQERRARGLDVLKLNIGDPVKYDFQTPAHLRKVVQDAVETKNYYAPSAGEDEAREAIAKEYGVLSKQVFLGTGVSAVLDDALNVLLNPQDIVLIPKPYYPLYPVICQKLGLQFALYETRAEEDWAPVLSDPPKGAKAILVNNPNNPTGVVYSKKVLREIVEYAATHKLVILADEIYDEIVFDEPCTRFNDIIKDEVPLITFNGLSKNFLAPGWRLGWMGLKNIDAKGPFVEAVQNILESGLSAPTAPQWAVKPALTGSKEHIKSMVKKLRERRDLVYKRLNEIPGFSCTKPQGAFYAFPKLPVKNDVHFVQELCKETGVLCVHGSGFGMQGYMRMVFLAQKEVLTDALDRIEQFTRKQNRK